MTLPPFPRRIVVTVLATAIGAAVTVALIAWSGSSQILNLLVSGGWALLLVPLFHLLPILATTLAWRSLLLEQGWSLPIWHLIWYRWLADSVNALLPVAQVGGELVRGHLATRSGITGPVAAASIIVDLTLGLTSLVVFILGALALCIGGATAPAIENMIAPVALFTLMIASFYHVQRSDLPVKLAHFMERQAGGSAWELISGGAASLNHELKALYAKPSVMVVSASWRLLAWLMGALEMGLALLLLGHAIGLRQALIFEGVSQVFRNIGFAIPGALGVQEGGMIAAGSLIGLGPELALTVSLVKRMRDLVLGAPALLGGVREISTKHRPTAFPRPAPSGQ
ncbi:MAG: lysylphosphatidylglycerol synthase domain-containing protein [Rhodospirillaceae bacterium]